MRKFSVVFALSLVAVLLLAATAVGAPAFPKIIPLPNGFAPEGIVSGYGTDFFVGSLNDGAIFRGDLRTGDGDVFIPGVPGKIAVGLAFDERSGYLYVAGGPIGTASVYDVRTGEQVGDYSLPVPNPGFVNDVIVTRAAAYFTDSFNALLYKVPLSADGRLPDAGAVETLALTGDWQQIPGPFVFNANGIEATPDGKSLIVVNTTTGLLYRVDPMTGSATEIDMGGEFVMAGDGLLLAGKDLYVMRNRENEIAVARLASDLSSGEIVKTITDPAFRVPTTLAEHGNSLYAVNARFDVPAPDASTDYDVVKVSKR